MRVLNIEGIDATLCCGTHLSNLSHLQVRFMLLYNGLLLAWLFSLGENFVEMLARHFM